MSKVMGRRLHKQSHCMVLNMAAENRLKTFLLSCKIVKKNENVMLLSGL